MPSHPTSSRLNTNQSVAACPFHRGVVEVWQDRVVLFMMVPSLSFHSKNVKTNKQKNDNVVIFQDQILLSHFEKKKTLHSSFFFCISFSYSWLICCYCLGENRSLTFWCKMWFLSVSVVSFSPSGGWICGSHSICSSSQLLLPPWDV